MILIIQSGYIQLARNYVERINEREVPSISSAVELMKSSECGRAMVKAIALYDTTMDKLEGEMPVTVENLTHAHKDAHEQAVKLYQKGALFDNDRTYITKLCVS